MQSKGVDFFMIGIYKITNNINNKIYVGQSVDIKRRWSEHKRSGQPEKYSHKSERDIEVPIHKAMQKYGIDNFSFEVLEECSKEELNEKERYYIKKLHSHVDEYGYNISKGGQESVGAKGQYHSQAKLTQLDVDNIYKMLQNGWQVKNICKKYPFVSKSTISMINQGKVWKKENYKYPLSDQSKLKINKGSKSGNAILNEDKVLEIRKYYVEHSFKEVVKKYSNYAKYSTLKSVVYGESWKHVPIYKKKQKIWIEPCIDYS